MSKSRMRKKTLPQLFIVESLKIKDEEEYRQEGDIVSRMLRLSGKKDTIYFYIRTRRELEKMIDRFGKSNYRYLHISCHANPHEISTTYDTIPNSKLSDMLLHQLHNRRVFVSACEMANEELASKLFAKSEILSFAGPIVRIGFDDAAAFWVSFYHLIFKIDEDSMAGENVRDILNKLSVIFNVKMNYFVRSKSYRGYKMYTFPIRNEGIPHDIAP